MRRIALIGLFIALCLILTGCGQSSKSSTKSSNNYDYDKGYGYTAPKSGESLNDYIKRQDPKLYKEMQDNWNSLN